jgi:hypothetical protein
MRRLLSKLSLQSKRRIPLSNSDAEQIETCSSLPKSSQGNNVAVPMQEACITLLGGDEWAHSLGAWKLVLGFRRGNEHCKSLYGEPYGWHRSADEQIKKNKEFFDCIQVQTKKENLHPSPHEGLPMVALAVAMEEDARKQRGLVEVLGRVLDDAVKSAKSILKREIRF